MMYTYGIQEEMTGMDTTTRLALYAQGGRKITERQRRRLVKKAGTDPHAIVMRDDGMGYSPAMQGYRELIFTRRAEPGEEGAF